MKKYLLIESDNVNNFGQLDPNTKQLADKVLNSKYEKLVNAAAIGSAGAMAYVTYLNKELLITGWRGFYKITSLAINSNEGYFGYLKNMVTFVFKQAFNLASGIIKLLTSGSLKFSDIKAGSGAAGSLFCLGTIAAILGMAMYKIYKIIKKKTPYNVNESEYLRANYKQIKQAMIETSFLFKSLQRLTEGDSKGSAQVKAESIIKKSQSPLKEMWDWVLTSKKVRHGALYIVFYCLVALCVGTVFSTVNLVL